MSCPFHVGPELVYSFPFFVSIYFTAAVMGAAMLRLNGGDPTISDGLRVARENWKRIAGWALVSATVGLILRALAERFGFIGRIVAGFAGAAWGIVTYLVVPVLIFEKIGPWAAVKRSGSLLRKTWGEAAGGYITLGAIFVLLALPGIAFFVIGALVGGVIGLIIGVAIAAIYWLILGLLGAAAQSILVNIPVKLYGATESKDLSFTTLHASCMTALRRPYVCPKDNVPVDSKEMVKGYEYAKGQYVILTDKDFDAVPLEASKALEVQGFVESAEISLALQLIKTLTREFDLPRFHDRYRDALMQLIQAKVEGKELPAVTTVEAKPTQDLMAALKASLAAAKAG